MKPTLKTCAKGWLLTFTLIPKPRSFDMFGADAEARRMLKEPRITHIPCTDQAEGFRVLAMYYKLGQVQYDRTR
jgi:hypothetical protein